MRGEGAGDGDALLLAAGELVRVALACGRVDPDGRQHLGDALIVGPGDVEADERLGDDVGDRHPRVERAERVLEHDLHVAAEPAQLVRTARSDRPPAERDRALRGPVEAEQDAGERRLARAGFADDAEGVAGGDVEADADEGAPLGPRAEQAGPRQPVHAVDVVGGEQTSCRSRRRLDRRSLDRAAAPSCGPRRAARRCTGGPARR